MRTSLYFCRNLNREKQVICIQKILNRSKLQGTRTSYFFSTCITYITVALAYSTTKITQREQVIALTCRDSTRSMTRVHLPGSCLAWAAETRAFLLLQINYCSWKRTGTCCVMSYVYSKGCKSAAQLRQIRPPPTRCLVVMISLCLRSLLSSPSPWIATAVRTSFNSISLL